MDIQTDDIKLKVEQRVRNSEHGKEFKDTDVVTYTRKYNAAYDIVTSQDLSKIETDNVTAYKLIEKSKIWPIYNVPTLQETGNSSGAAYIKVKAREMISARPIDSKDARETYVRSIEKLISLLDEAKKFDSVIETLKSFINLDKFDFGVIPSSVRAASYTFTSRTGNLATHNERDIQKYFDDIFGKRFYGFCRGSSEAALKARSEALLIEEFTLSMQDAVVTKREQAAGSNKLRYEKILSVIKDTEDNAKELYRAIRSVDEYANGGKYEKAYLIDRYQKVIDQAGRSREEIRKDLPAYLQVRENDWSWAGQKKEKSDKAEVNELDKVAKSPETIFQKYGIEDWKKKVKRTPLEYIKRTGGLNVDKIDVKQVTDNFGYRNVVFGNYVNNQERKESLRHFLGAMLDMHEIINMDIKEINELGGLDINFGSTGCGAFSGAMACYFPSLKAINLTKKRGDGSLAHEWSHYFDNLLGEGAERRATNSQMATQYKTYLNGSEKIKTLFLEWKNWLLTGGTERVVNVGYSAQRKYKYRIQGTTVEEAIAYVQKAYPRYAKHENSHEPDIIKYYGYIAYKLNGGQKLYVPLNTKSSYYYYISRLWGVEYYASYEELFARAFAWFVEDALKQKNRVSNYLVDNVAGLGVMAILAPQSEWPFPYEEAEKVFLRDWFDRLFSAVRTEYNINPFHWDTTERGDEYSEYAPEKNAKIDAGVIVEQDGDIEALGEVQEFPGGKSFRRAAVDNKYIYQLLISEKPTKVFITKTPKSGWEIFSKQDDGTDLKIHAEAFKTLSAAQEYVVDNQLEVKKDETKNEGMKKFGKEEWIQYAISLFGDDARTTIRQNLDRLPEDFDYKKALEISKHLLKNGHANDEKLASQWAIQIVQGRGFDPDYSDIRKFLKTDPDQKEQVELLIELGYDVPKDIVDQISDKVKKQDGKTISTADDSIVSIQERDAPVMPNEKETEKAAEWTEVNIEDVRQGQLVSTSHTAANGDAMMGHTFRVERIKNENGFVTLFGDGEAVKKRPGGKVQVKIEAENTEPIEEIKPTVPTGEKTVITPVDLPKDGTEFKVHMPQLGQFAAKDITLKYDPNNFVFKATLPSGETANIGERQIIENFANGLYEWPKESSKKDEILSDAYKQLEIRDTPEFKALNEKLSEARRRVRDAKSLADLNAANFDFETLDKQMNEFLSFSPDPDDSPEQITEAYEAAKKATWDKFSLGERYDRQSTESLVAGLSSYPDRLPSLLPDYIKWAEKFPKKYWPNFNVFDIDGHLYGIVKYLKQNNKSLFELLPAVSGTSMPKVIRFTVSPDDEKCIKFHSKFATRDDMRPVMMGTHFDAYGAVTTDTHYLLFTPYRGDEEKSDGNFCHTKKCIENKKQVSESKYPKYQAVVPKDNQVVDINIPALLDFIATLEKWHQVNSVTELVGLDTGDIKIAFPISRLSQCINAMLELGHKNLQMGYSQPNRAVLFVPAGRISEAESFKADFILLMPIMLGGQYSDDTAITWFNLETGCILDPNEISFCFDDSKNAVTAASERTKKIEQKIEEQAAELKKLKAEKTDIAEPVAAIAELSKADYQASLDGAKIALEFEEAGSQGYTDLQNYISGLEIAIEMA